MGLITYGDLQYLCMGLWCQTCGVQVNDVPKVKSLGCVSGVALRIDCLAHWPQSTATGVALKVCQWISSCLAASPPPKAEGPAYI